MPATKQTTPTPTAAQRRRRDGAVEEIARKRLRVPTLATRGSDRLDFYDLAVWTLQAALEAAYDAGRSDAARGTR